MGKSDTLEDVVNALSGVKKVTVVSHYNPDADAYGSSGAITLALKSCGIEAICCNDTPLLDRYRFIPGSGEIVNTWQPSDVIIVCDCGDIERVGEAFKVELAKAPKIINVDHHSSNTRFGHINFVEEKASSTSELIFHLVKALGIELTPGVATAIFTGISGDTGSFRYSSTSAGTFQVAAELVNCGVRPDVVGREIWGSNPLSSVLLHAEVLRNMKLHASGKLAETTADDSTYKLVNAVAEDSEGIVERARDIYGVNISVFIRWDKDIWRISMRSVDEKYNVSAVAQEFGGGGHKVAAAFRWRKGLEELRALLIPKLEKLALSRAEGKR